MRGATLALGTLIATLATTGTAAARPASWSLIRTYMHRTYELGPLADPRFGSISRRTVTSDGHGGSLTAVIGVRMPTADAKGQLVFFFHNQKFLGWDSNRESLAIADVKANGPRRFRVSYVRYADNDALCCPTRGRATVRYRWNGHRIVAKGRIPHPNWFRVFVRLRKR